MLSVPPPPRRRPLGSICRRLALLFPLSIATTWAQTAATLPNATADDDIVTLSPFEVRTDQDTGYVATNTLAGSRLNTPLAVTPAAISVFTKDFLEDIGATNVNAAVEYALGASNDVERTGNVTVAQDFSYRVRGFLGASAGRNYFPWSLSSDSYNVERLDFSRGPNSILFGVGGPGGIINTTPKQARFDKAFQTARLRIASWDDLRVELDFNQPLSEHVAARINLLKQQADGWRDFEAVDREGIALALTWKLSDSTELRFDGEAGDVEQNKPRPFPAGDGYSLWANAGSPISPTFGANVAGSATLGARISINPLTGPFQGQAVPLNNFRRSNGPTLVGVPNPPQILDEAIAPFSSNLMGPGGNTDFDYYSAGVFLSQRIGRDLFIEVAANRQEEHRIRYSPMNFNDNRLEVDINAMLPVFNAAGVQTGTAPNPNVGKYFVDGQPRTDIADTLRDNVRVTAAYALELGKLGKHNLAALVSRDDSSRESIGTRMVNVSPNRQVVDTRNAANTISYLTYIDLNSNDPAQRGLVDPFQHSIVDQPILGTAFRVTSGLPARTWTDTRSLIETAMFAVQSTYWNDRIFTTLGVRRDRARDYGSSEIVATDGSNIRLGAIRNTTADVDVSGNTITTGGLFKVSDWLSVFYNKSENFQPQPNATVWSPVGSPRFAGNVAGEGEDYGVKLTLLDERLFATIAGFRTDEVNRRQSVNGLYSVYFESMWDALGQNTDLEGGDTRSTTSDGYELEITANLTKQWRLAFNFGHIETAESDLFPNIRRYLAEHRGTFAAQSSTAIDTATFPTSRATIGDVLDALDAQIVADTSTEGQSPRRHRENTANLFTNYRFESGPLRNLSVGFGAQYRGGAVVGYTTAGDKVVSDDYVLANAMISYQRKIRDGRATWKIQLNIDNVFDFDDLQPIDSGFDSGGNLVALGQLQTPRRFALTNTISF